MGTEAYKNVPNTKSIAKLEKTWLKFEISSKSRIMPLVLRKPAEVIDAALACSTRPVPPLKVQRTITKSMEGCHVRKAEIIWALTIAHKDFSSKSAKDISETFKTMFPDSQIAISFQCGGGKIKYLTKGLFICENVARFCPTLPGQKSCSVYMKLVALFAGVAMGHVTLFSCVWHLSLVVNHQLPR